MDSLHFEENCNHHCDIIFQGDEQSNITTNQNYRNCTLNPGHTDFLTVEEFALQHIPMNLRTKTHWDLIQNHIDRTVRILVSHTSLHRPDTYPDTNKPYPFCDLKGNNFLSRCGTGYLEGVWRRSVPEEKQCPCVACKKLKLSKDEDDNDHNGNRSNFFHQYFWMSTSTHVVYDKNEAQSAIFELFFDSDDRQGVEYLYGVDVVGDENSISRGSRRRAQTVHCIVVCVTHDPRLALRLEKILTREEINNDLSPYYENRLEVKSERFPQGKLYNYQIFSHDPELSIRLKKMHGARNTTTQNTDIETIPAAETAGLIVSHPHGASKRISVGNFSNIFMAILQSDLPVTLDKAARIRLSKGHDKKEHNIYIEKTEHSSPNKLSVDSRPMFRLRYLRVDVRIMFPPAPTRVVYMKFPWIRLPHGTVVITDGGLKYHTPPMDVNIDGFYSPFLSQRVFVYHSYDMPTCPGTSGARVLELVQKPFSRAITHHGCSRGGDNISGLIGPL